MKKCNSNVKEDLEWKLNSKFKTRQAKFAGKKNSIHLKKHCFEKNKNKKIKRKKYKINKKVSSWMMDRQTYGQTS